MDKVKELTDFYVWMQENDSYHNIRTRVEKKAEVYLKGINVGGQIPVHNVNRMLLLHDIEELDNIILELNSRKISLDEFARKVWDTAHTLGQEEGYRCNNR